MQYSKQPFVFGFSLYYAEFRSARQKSIQTSLSFFSSTQASASHSSLMQFLPSFFKTTSLTCASSWHPFTKTHHILNPKINQRKRKILLCEKAKHIYKGRGLPSFCRQGVQADESFVSVDPRKMTFFHEQINKSHEQMPFKQTRIIINTIKNVSSCLKCVDCNC